MLCFLRMSKNQLFFAISIVLVSALGVVGLLLFPQPATSPVLSPEEGKTITAEEGATSTPISLERPSISVSAHPLPLFGGDTVASWDFKGAYTGNPELEAKAKGEIVRYSDLLAAATSSKMILLVAIANEYELLGKGKEQYEYLGRAVRAEEANGLPWHNLGVLMERIHAYETARVAYKKATTLQPQFMLYHFAYLEFLIQNMKTRADVIEEAFTNAEKNIGKVQDLLDLRASWKQS